MKNIVLVSLLATVSLSGTALSGILTVGGTILGTGRDKPQGQQGQYDAERARESRHQGRRSPFACQNPPVFSSVSSSRW